MPTGWLQRFSRWLTPRRMAIQAAALAVCLWSGYAWNMATPGVLDRMGQPKGCDFLHLYTVGTLAQSGRGDLLYDLPAQAALIQKMVPGAGAVIFVPLYGPQVAMFFAPWSRLPYAWAVTLWMLLNAVLYALCCGVVWRECPNLRRHAGKVAWVACAFPGLFSLIAWGQTAGVALALFTATWLALRSRLFFFAGLFLGSLVFKPQLALAAAFVFLLAWEWKVIAGALLAATAQMAVAWEHFGTAVMADYGRHLMQVRGIWPLLEPKPYATHSLRTFWAMLLPWPGAAFGLYVVTALVVLIAALLCWRSAAPLALKFAVLMTATVLTAPHLGIYDLVILAPPFLLLADWMAEQPGSPSTDAIRVFLYLSCVLPLLAPLARMTQVQLSVLALASLHLVLWQTIRQMGSLNSGTVSPREGATAGG